jgi:hypothetical protein
MGIKELYNKFDLNKMFYFKLDKMDEMILYKHGMESLRFAFTLFGYDKCIKELNFINHLNNSTINTEVKTNITETIQKQDVIEVNEINNSSDTSEKNIVIQPTVKYSRVIPPDALRCTSLIGEGIRCTLKREKNSEMCSRHTKISNK